MDYWKELKINNNIIYISIIIYTISDNDIFVLVGKEFNNKPNKTDIGLYSDFSGGFDNEEEALTFAEMRADNVEQVEENTQRIIDANGIYQIVEEDTQGGEEF